MRRPGFRGHGAARRRWARRAFAIGRLALLLVILVALYVWNYPSGLTPPSVLATGEEAVRARFTRCGPGRGPACVVDGDTFKLGQRKIRISGIDAPEVQLARCAEEARLGEAATARLQQWLNRGPFVMVGWSHRPRDKYGRELMTVTRSRADGSSDDLGDWMTSSGLARDHDGFKPTSWC